MGLFASCSDGAFWHFWHSTNTSPRPALIPKKTWKCQFLQYETFTLERFEKSQISCDSCLCLCSVLSHYFTFFWPALKCICCSAEPWTSGRWLNSNPENRITLLETNFVNTCRRTIWPQRKLCIPDDPAGLQLSGRLKVRQKLPSVQMFSNRNPFMTRYAGRCFSIWDLAFYCAAAVWILWGSHLFVSGRAGRGKGEEGGDSSVSPFTLQERSQRGAEGMQSLAQPAQEDTTLNMLISPLISA